MLVPETRAARAFALAGLVLATAGRATAAPAADAAAAARPRTYTIEQFVASTMVRDASFSHDESRILFSADESGVFNVYSVPVAGGPATALTRSTTDNVYAVSCFPHDDRYLFRRDRGGNENDHLYVAGPDLPERDLTPGDKVKATFAGWTKAGDAFYVLVNDRDPRFFDLHRYDAKTYERTLVYRDETGYALGAISPDGRWLAFAKPARPADSDIHLYDAQTGRMKHITPHEGRAEHEPEAFDPESRFLYYLTNAGGEFMRVARYELATGKHEEVERADWDVLFTGFSENGTYRVSGTNEDGRTIVRLWNTKTGRGQGLPSLPFGEIASIAFSRSDKRLALYVKGDRVPDNLYAWEPGQRPVRLTDTLNKEIDPSDLVEGTVVRFPSFDGLTIPSLLWKPHPATPERKAPALVWVHGGPGGQTRHGYSALIQYLVNHGYVVLGINNRGSSGYGKSFYVADDRKHGREPLWDCIEGKKYLASLPYVDGDRIGIIGGSYGGYMVAAALAFKPEEFAVGVNIFGVTNWVRTLESIPPYWEVARLSLYEEIGDPATQKEMLREISPLFHAEKIRRPLMVLQGANDPRVIQPESDDLVAAARKNGVPVEYVVFPDEGHGFRKKKNQIEGWGKILAFLDRYLKGAPVSGGAGADRALSSGSSR